MTETTTDAVVETPAATEAAPDTTEAKAVDRDEAGRFKNPAQPRIDELTRARREAEREAQYWRTRAQTREAQDSAKAAPTKPTPDKFTDNTEYLEALTDFKASEKVSVELQKDREERAKEAAAERNRKAWAESSAKARELHKDYDEVLSASDVGISDNLRKALDDSDDRAGLAYHLSKNPAIAERLNGLSETGAAREIGRLEAQLAKAPEAKVEPVEEEVKETPVRKTSAAPPPAKPVPSGRSSPVDLAKMGMDDYVKTRKSQGARWAR